VAYHIF